MKTVNEIVEEIKNNYGESDILKIIKGLQVKKAKPVANSYKNDIVNVFATIKDNKIRPVLSKCKVTKDEIIGTDLECTVIIKNTHNIPEGIYTKQMVELKTYQETYKDEFEEFPIIKYDRQGKLTTYSKTELEEALNKVIFCANKSDENLALKCVRFNNKFIATTDTYRMITVDLNSNTEFSLPLDSAKVLQKILKSSNAETVQLYDEDRLEFYIDDTILISRKIDLPFPDVKNFEKNFVFTSNIVIKHSSEELIDSMKKLHKVSCVNRDSKNSFIIDFKNKVFKAIGIDNKIEIPFEFTGNVDFDLISLNAKMIEEYLKTVSLNKVEIDLYNNRSAVKINKEYIIMPLAM